ncbi:cytochrome c4 [Roseomonas sp. GC11]|uniref:c-type cytochrome n=1 Tax=Roseomonas sp. GC11 TaxID=2950546 RepID=UPI00210A6ACA|nr:c-type cytochrome [Roseomonas sp. GC11]MCQ4159650.1 cytochrome c4 [Roseomonas sp. GC11]
MSGGKLAIGVTVVGLGISVLAGALVVGNPAALLRSAYTHPETAAAPSGPYYPQPERLPPYSQVALTGDARLGEQIFNRGGGGGVAACSTCHGAQGVPVAGAPYPRLAGLSADYVAKQLYDYASGERTNEQMRPFAKALSPVEIGAVATFVATLKAPETELSSPAQVERGRQIAEIGDNAHAIPACGACHGLAGRGQGDMLPPLAGQPRAYILSQFNAWRADRRQNDQVTVMHGIAQRMPVEDIEAVASYFASLRQKGQ